MLSEWESPNYSTLFKCLVVVGSIITLFAMLIDDVPRIGAIFLVMPWVITFLLVEQLNGIQRVKASGTIIIVQIIYILICWRFSHFDSITAGIGLFVISLCLPLWYLIGLGITWFITLLISSYREDRSQRTRL